MQISVAVTDANNIVCTVVPPQTQTITIDRGVAGNGIVSIVPVTISTFQYLRITYTNGTVSDVGPLTSTAYTATSPISIVGNTISLLTVPIASGGTAATTAAAAIQNLLPSYTGNASKRLGLNSGATALEWVADGNGTVTSVALSGGSTGLTTSGGPITSSGTITLAGTLAIANGGTGQTTAAAAITALTGSQTNAYYLRSNGTNATLSGLAAADLTGTVSIATGGSGQNTAQAAMNAFAGAVTSGSYLRGNGTNVVLTTIQAGDVPTLNQNTTGTAANVTATSNSTLTTLSALSLPGSQVSGNISGNAANVTGTVAIANGGTGATTAATARTNLGATTVGGNLFTLTNPSAITFPQFNADNTVSALTASAFRTAIGAGSGAGTVTSVAATVPSFLSISGSPITTSGTLALTLSGTALPTTSGGTGLTSFTSGGVVYASSTSALATGSALTFDGTTITNTASASSVLAVTGKSLVFYNASTSDALLRAADDSSTVTAIGFNKTDTKFYSSGSEQMRLTSTGLGIGTSSPSTKLTVVSANPTNGYVASFGNSQGSAGRTGTYLLFDATSLADWKIGIPPDVNAFSFYDVVAGAERMRLDSSGNLGLGVTPSAWGGGYKAFEVNAGSVSATTGAGTLVVSNNSYYNGTNYIYKATGVATDYIQTGGQHWWRNAPSGTAGNAITFTQAMTLDAGGNLMVGLTNGSARLEVKTANSAQYAGYFSFVNTGYGVGINNNSGGSAALMYFFSPNYVGEINTNGTVTGYVSASDYRLKNSVAPMTNALAKVAALKPVTYKWNTDGSDGEGFIAHELAEVCPQAVFGEKDAIDAKGKPKYQGIDTSFLVATLTAALQEQQALIESLTTRLTALEGKA